MCCLNGALLHSEQKNVSADSAPAKPSFGSKHL